MPLYDTHLERAARLFGVPVAEVTPAQREQAKLYLFLKIFGASPKTINQHLTRLNPQRTTQMNTHSTLRDAILIKLRSLPVKRLARFAAISVNDDCRCVMGALYGSHKFYDKWVISERIDGVIRHRWANDMVAEWARKRGLTHYHVLRLIEINDRDPNAHVPLKDYRAETPSERYQRVVAEVDLGYPNGAATEAALSVYGLTTQDEVRLIERENDRFIGRPEERFEHMLAGFKKKMEEVTP